MKLTVRLVALLALLLVPAWPLLADDTGAPVSPPHAPASEAKPQVAVTGRYEAKEGRRVLTLWGTPRERGFAQGYLLAEQVVAGVERDFKRIMNPRFKLLYKGLLTTMVIPRFQFDKRELEELDGLMAGVLARLPKEKLVIEALGRPFKLVDLKALNTFGDWYGLGCSSLAAWGDLTKDGKLLVGRNFDFPAFDLVLKHQYVVVRAPEGELPGQVGVSYPGCIGTMTGMNAHGVFVAIHDVRVKPTIDKAMRANVPRLLSVRRILEKTKGADACGQARDLTRSWPTLYGNNLMVVAPKRKDGVPCAAVLEYDNRVDVDKGVTMRITDTTNAFAKDAPPALCLACTNHHRCRVGDTNKPKPLFPHWRYKELSGVGGEAQPKEPLDVQGMFGWMGKTAFPRGEKVQGSATSLYGEGRHHGTLHQVVAEPEAGRMHVKLGLVGKHIRDVAPHAYDVANLISAAKPATPTTGK